MSDLSPHPSSNDLTSLIAAYLRVCNLALQSSKKQKIIAHTLDPYIAHLSQTPLQINIIDDQPHISIEMHADDQGLDATIQNTPCPSTTKKLMRSYLEHVVQNPDTYIQNPAKLDWDWLFDLHGKKQD